jgi:flagellar P-ring protein precursor FlgI
MLKQASIVCLLLASLLGSVRSSRGEFRIGDACRVKGQEENVLQGMGIVAGLKGTGDGDSKPTQRALAQMMELMGNRLGTGPQGQVVLDELKNAKNVALVFVTAKVPAAGAEPGDLVDCTLSAVSAKSLQGGYLMISALKGPNPRDPHVYATAQGLLVVDDASLSQTARIPNGATVEREFRNEFVDDGKITLILDKEYASFDTSAEIERLINQSPDFRSPGMSSSEGVAKARGQDRVEVMIPEIYKDQVESFISYVMEIRLPPPVANNSVIVNKRLQAIIVGADVEIAPVAVMHKNRVIQTGGAPPANEFVPLDITEAQGNRNVKLKGLVDALNALQVPTDDVIDIIVMLKQKRALSGQLIVQ